MQMGLLHYQGFQLQGGCFALLKKQQLQCHCNQYTMQQVWSSGSSTPPPPSRGYLNIAKGLVGKFNDFSACCNGNAVLDAKFFFLKKYVQNSNFNTIKCNKK